VFLLIEVQDRIWKIFAVNNKFWTMNCDYNAVSDD
jgi:hypothetical protein